MGVVFFVATQAITRGIAALRFTVVGVTAGARRYDMGALQREVRFCVIEHAEIESQDVMGSALVFRVAGAAREITRTGVAPVKPLPGLTVLPLFLMAGDAESRFAPGVERTVTATAVVLGFGMRRRNRARHHQPLEVDRTSRCLLVKHDDRRRKGQK